MTHLRAVLDVPVIVLRLLRVDGGYGSRDGHVIPLPPSAPPSAARRAAELSTRLCNI